MTRCSSGPWGQLLEGLLEGLLATGKMVTTYVTHGVGWRHHLFGDGKMMGKMVADGVKHRLAPLFLGILGEVCMVMNGG